MALKKKRRLKRKYIRFLSVMGVIFTFSSINVVFSWLTPQSQALTITTTIPYQQHRFYGEVLQFESATPFTNYHLRNLDTGESFQFTQGTTTDSGIQLSELTPGTYQLALDTATLSVSHALTESTWYTVTRKQEVKEITLITEDNQLLLAVTSQTELPDSVYDIIIDPGHGGLDSGAVANGYFESDLMLEFSLYLTELLRDYGLKVKLTRTTDNDPAGDASYHLNESPYYDNGRVEQVYQYQAKYVFSNHLNSTASGTASGFQIYSPVATTNTLALQLSRAFQQAGLQPSELLSDAHIGEGTYKLANVCYERISEQSNCRTNEEDYFFMIRETGGTTTSAQNLSLFNDNYHTTPHFGAQTLLMEYAFIDNERDMLTWEEHWQHYAQVMADAIANYLEL